MYLIIKTTPACVSCFRNEYPKKTPIICMSCISVQEERRDYKPVFKISDDVSIKIDAIRGGSGEIVSIEKEGGDLIKCLEAISCNFIITRESNDDGMQHFCRWCGMKYLKGLDEVDVKYAHGDGCIVTVANKLLDRLEIR